MAYANRQARLERIAKIIENNFEDGEWFTCHDILSLWNEKYRNGISITTRELGKLLPAYGLPSEQREGLSYKCYQYVKNPDGTPLYTKNKRIWDEEE